MSVRHLFKYTTRLLPLFMLALAVPTVATARCEPFDFFESISEIPFIVFGKVTSSNKQDILSAPCYTDPCRHEFVIKVIEVLKGNILDQELHINYSFVQQRPNIVLFAEGDDYLFAISNVAPGGQAILFGTTCGRSGLPVEYLQRTRDAVAVNERGKVQSSP